MSDQVVQIHITLPGQGGSYVGDAAVPLVFQPDPEPDPVEPVPASRTVPGVHDTLSPAHVKAAYPGTVFTREFIPGVLSGPRSLIAATDKLCRPSWSAGLTPMFSFKLDRDQVAAGQWDSVLAELAQWLGQQPDAYVIPWHEPEDDMTGAQFAAFFNRVADRMRTANPFVRMVYASMAYQWAPKKDGGSIAGRTYTPADWRAADADFVAADVYSGRSFPLRAILPEHPGFARWMAEIVGDRTYMVTERGFETGTDHQLRAEQIDRETDWLLTDPVGQRCTAWLYWNTGGTESSSSLVLDEQYGEPALRVAISRLAA